MAYNSSTDTMVVPFHQYEQMDNSDNEDGEVVTSDLGGGVYIPLPPSIENFNWYTFVSQEKKDSYKRETAMKITQDMLPESGVVQKSHVINRMNFLKQKLIGDNYKNTKEALDLMRDYITAKVNSWLKAFIVFCCNEINMTYKEQPLKTWNDYLGWIQHNIESKNDALNIIKTLYLSFQHNEEYRLHIRYSLMVEFNLKFQKLKVKQRSSRNFIEKLISHRLNQFRKQVCTRSSKYNGYSYRVIRKQFTKTSSRERNYPKYYFPWMIQWDEPTYIPKKLGRPFGTNSSVVTNPRPMMTYHKTEKVTTHVEILSALDQINQLQVEMMKKLEMLDNNNSKYLN